TWVAERPIRRDSRRGIPPEATPSHTALRRKNSGAHQGAGATCESRFLKQNAGAKAFRAYCRQTGSNRGQVSWNYFRIARDPGAIQMPAVRESLLRHHLAYETRRFRLLPALGLAGACRTAPFHSASLHI